MIDIGFINGGVETRFFRTGLAPEKAIVKIKRCSGVVCMVVWFLVEGVASALGVWIALGKISSIWDLSSLGAAAKTGALCFFYCLCDRLGANACRNLQTPGYCGDFRVERWVVMNVAGRAIGKGELSLWVHWMITLSEMRKSK